MRRILLLLLASSLAACPKNEAETKKSEPASKADEPEKKKPKDDGDEASKKEPKKAKEEEPEEPAKPLAPPPVCTVAAQKSWGKGVNTLTGLTAIPLTDGRTAIGYALGNTPQVLVVGTKGEGKILKVAIDPASAFAANAPKPGQGAVRTLWRVTPTKLEDKLAHAFVDFRDQYKLGSDAKAQAEKGKRVVCGPADSSDKWVLDQGPAWFEDPKTNKDPIAAIVDHNGQTGVKGGGLYHEVRDCRTFYDPKKDETWVVGSRLQIEIDDAGAAKTAQSELFIESGKDGTLQVVHKTPIKIDKALKPIDYEVPVSHELADGSFVVAARVGFGALVAAQLEHDKKVRGTFKAYQGYYNMPDVAEDGPDDVLMASLKIGKDAYALRAMRVPGTKNAELPAAFSKVTTDEDESHSESRPEFLRDAKGQRWVAYIENAEKGKGHLEIIPVTPTFRASGRPYAVTTEDEKATEARLVAQSGGGFVVAYIRDQGDGVGELVTEDLDCKVEN